MNMKRAFAAIRKTEGHEWIDSTTIGGLPETARNSAKRDAMMMPGWSAANPVQRIAEIGIVELDGGSSFLAEVQIASAAVHGALNAACSEELIRALIEVFRRHQYENVAQALEGSCKES